MSRNTDVSRVAFTSDVDVHELLTWAEGSGVCGKAVKRKEQGKQLVHISRFRFDADNPRTVFFEVASFATSVGDKLEEAIEIEIGPGGTVVIVEGHRRFLSLLYYLRAAGKDPRDLGLVILCKLTDEEDKLSNDELLASRLRRNDEREGYHPIDEARTLLKLMQNRQVDAAGLAAQLKGKFTLRYITGRVSLLNLATRAEDGVAALDYFLTGSLLEPEALQIARLPKHLQKVPFLQITSDQITIRGLRDMVNRLLGAMLPAAITPAPIGTVPTFDIGHVQKVATPKATKKRAPQFAAAPKLNGDADRLLGRTMFIQFGSGKGSVEVQFRIPANRSQIHATFTPDSEAKITPNSMAVVLRNLADQLQRSEKK